MRNAIIVSGLAVFAAILAPGELAARPGYAVHTPAQGSAERRAILNAIRPRVERDLGAPVEFVVRTLRVSGNHAFVGIEPQRPGGGRINPRNTPLGRKLLRDEGSLDLFDCCHTEVLLQRSRGQWRITQIGIGATDVWYLEACNSQRRGLCPNPYSKTD